MTSHQTRAITRNRERLACVECRQRKLKCDRRTPCSSCVRRRVPSSCGYERPGPRLEEERERRVHAEDRLAHLETLVNELAAQQSLLSPSSGPGLQTATASSSAGDTTEASSYNGPTHWSAMLEDIQALRSTLTPDHAEYELPEQTMETGINLLFGAGFSTVIDFGEVLSRYLPSRQETDRLIAAYFQHKSIAAPFIHPTQFRRAYQNFWTSPTTASPLWTSILFSICHISLYTHRRSTTGNADSPSSHLSIASARCLSLGFYFRPQPFAVEALLLFAQAQCLTSLELPSDLGSLFGVLIRLATQMGYHRDPDTYMPKRFTLFEAEMRRRTWSLAMQLDLLVSFNLGLPSNVQFPTWTTKAPRAIMSEELREDMEKLPLERGDGDFVTDILFYVVKHRFMEVFEKILRHTLTKGYDKGQTQEGELEALDKQVRDVYNTMPEDIRPREMTDSIADSPATIAARLCVSNLYNKSLCVLHRPYVALGRSQSVLVCCASAKAIVRDMVGVYSEFEPGGQMETEIWFMSSLTWHDFLFGATALCLVLCKLEEDKEHSDSDVGKLLGKARAIFATEAPRRSRDTMRVLALIDATFRYVGAQANKSQGSDCSIPDVVMAPGDLEATQQTSQFEETPVMPRPLEDRMWEYLDQFLELEP